jgi:hypothetical protein
MTFNTKVKYNFARLLFSITPPFVVLFFIKFNIKAPQLLISLVLIFGCFVFDAIFEYFNSTKGYLTGKERIKIDKNYRNRKIFFVVGFVLLFIVHIILWYKDLKTN